MRFLHAWGFDDHGGILRGKPNAQRGGSARRTQWQLVPVHRLSEYRRCSAANRRSDAQRTRCFVMSGTSFGTSPKRKEDFELLTGRGRFVDDIELPGMYAAAFVRSPLALSLIHI